MTNSSSSKKKAIVLGGGLCGKTVAHLLADTHEVTIFDHGMDNGLLKSKLYEDSNGQFVSVDYCAPHLFNSRDEEVKKFVFQLMPPGLWMHNKRNAKIFIQNQIIGYPFEFNLWEFGGHIMSQCLDEIKDVKDVDNLHDFFLNRFGPTMCNMYHFPYSKKIWQYPLELITTNWLQPNKIPISTKEELLLVNMQRGGHEQRMTHSEFYYPKYGGIEMLIDSLFAAPQPIKINPRYFSVIYEDNKVWVWNGLKVYSADVLISTIPIKQLCKYTTTLTDINPQYHGTDVLVAKSDFFIKNPGITWIYFPEEAHFWHRIANVGLLQGTETDIVTIEAPGGAYYGQSLDLFPYRFEVIDHYNIPMTYPIETAEKPKIDALIERFKKEKIYSIGRWGAHNYNSNMDLTIRAAMDCVKEVTNG